MRSLAQVGFVLVEGLGTVDMLRLKAQSGEDVSKLYRRLFCECLCQTQQMKLWLTTVLLKRGAAR